MKTLTDRQYAVASVKLDIHDKAVKEYRLKNKTNAIPVEVSATFPFANEIDNDLRSAIEVYEFNASRPDKYFVYVGTHSNECTHTTATTWTGQLLGTIKLGHVWTSNFGDKRQSITMMALNGDKYTGTYYRGAGTYARIKKVKKA